MIRQNQRIMSKLFSGVGTALVTPFKQDQTIDYKAFERIIEHNIKGGVSFLVVQGTTGEAATLTTEQKIATVEFAIEVVRNRVPVVLGYGGNNTQKMLDEMGEYPLAKTQGILVASPYYNKPSQDGIYRHYDRLNQFTPVPIILYNVPGRTGSNMSAQTTLSLARDMENIVAIKEASGDLKQMSDIIKGRPDDFIVLSGDDDLVLPQMAIGADGVISVIANAFPSRFSKLIAAAKSGDVDLARTYHYQFLDVIPRLFQEGNPGGIKAVLSMLGLCQNELRLPLAPISKALYDELYRAISDADLTD